MQLGTLLVDDDAVSPVIGVVLMVGITVALAAVIATFVLGVNTTTEVPDVEFRYDAEDGSTDGWGDSTDSVERFVIHHDGGEPVDMDRVTVQYAGTPVGSISWLSVSGPGSTWEVGESMVLEDPSPGSGGDFGSDQQVLVLWSSGSGSSQILANGDLP